MTATNTLLRQTDSISFYSPHLAELYARLGWLTVLPIEAPSTAVPVGCFWLRHVELGATARTLVALLREVAAQSLKHA